MDKKNYEDKFSFECRFLVGLKKRLVYRRTKKHWQLNFERMKEKPRLDFNFFEVFFSEKK
jgi:hypothetical protein